jgi:hypothetical protein
MLSFCSGVLVMTLGAATAAGAAEVPNAVFDKAMEPVLTAYLTLQTSLAADTMVGVADAAKSIAKLARALDASQVTGDYAPCKDLPTKLSTAADALARQTTIASARQQLKELSKPMALWGTLAKPKGISVAYCSMASASWLQPAGGLRNPYYGAAMLTCGEIVGGAGEVKK